MGSGVSYKVKKITVEQLSVRLLEIQSVLNNQTTELNSSNHRVRQLERTAEIFKRKESCSTCLRHIREYDIIESETSKKHFLSFTLHALTQTMRFPEFCEAQIVLFDHEDKMCVETRNYDISHWPLEVTLLCPNHDKCIGKLTLKYNIEIMNVDENYWTKGEERFVSSVCKLIALKVGVHDKIQLLETADSQRSILDDILPARFVDSLLETGEIPSPRSYSCTILFTDVVGFTHLCSQTTPKHIVTMLNEMYSAFDDLVIAGGDDLYKVETIGDSYMVVSGLPHLCKSHAATVVQLAMDFREAMSSIKLQLLDGSTVPIQIRCGIHSGEVAAGIVGKLNQRYCLIGDTVNTASRMESSSETMKIQISKETHHCIQLNRLSLQASALLKKVKFMPRCGVRIKGKGSLDTYWVIEDRSGSTLQCDQRRITM